MIALAPMFEKSSAEVMAQLLIEAKYSRYIDK
jgi:hypothetical protein